MVVMLSAGLIMMLSAFVLLWGGLPESVAETVKVARPDAVGVPERVEPLRLSPAGRFPLFTLQLMVPAPPVAAREAE